MNKESRCKREKRKKDNNFSCPGWNSSLLVSMSVSFAPSLALHTPKLEFSVIPLNCFLLRVTDFQLLNRSGSTLNVQ